MFILFQGNEARERELLPIDNPTGVHFMRHAAFLGGKYFPQGINPKNTGSNKRAKAHKLL
jgi:hypothetical protein